MSTRFVAILFNLVRSILLVDASPAGNDLKHYSDGGDYRNRTLRLLRRHYRSQSLKTSQAQTAINIAKVWPGASAPSDLYLQCLGLSIGLLELSLSAEPRVTNAWTELLLFRVLRCRLPFGYPLDRFILTACRLFFYIKPFGSCQLAAFRLLADFSFIQTVSVCVKRLTSSLFRFALNNCARLD